MTTYYAYYRSPQTKKLTQVLVAKEPGQPSSSVETGITYKSDREALADLAKLNVQMAARQ